MLGGEDEVAERADIEDREGGPVLTIGFLVAEPLDAAEVGEVLRALSRDYHQLTGGRLVLASLETGSIWLKLRDALTAAGGLGESVTAIAAAAENLGTFWKLMKGYLQRSKSAEPQPVPGSTSPLAAIAKMTEVAARNGAGMDFIYREDANGSKELKLSMSPNEISRAAKRANSDRRNAKKPKAPRLRGPTSLEALTDRLSTQIELDPSSLESVVDIVIELLQANGLAGQLPILASSLEARGLWDIAAAVRRRIPPGSATQYLTRD